MVKLKQESGIFQNCQECKTVVAYLDPLVLASTFTAAHGPRR